MAAVIYKPTPADLERYAQMNVLVLTPSGSYNVPFKFARCVANMISFSSWNDLSVSFAGTERMVIHWARNHLALNARDLISDRTGKPYTHFLWLDDDQTFNPDLLCYLGRNGDKDMVSALYFSREPGLPMPVAYLKSEEGDKYRHDQLIDPPQTVIEVDAVGFGACLMRREVIEGTEGPWFRFDGCGEDIYFCVKAKEAGFKVWLDGSYRIGHIGDPHVVTVADYERYMEQHKAELGNLTKVEMQHG
jgi:hypothetical protein